jgi:hypothetical protein
LAADVIRKPSDSIAASKTIYDVLTPEGEVIIVSADAKHRFWFDMDMSSPLILSRSFCSSSKQGAIISTSLKQGATT